MLPSSGPISINDICTEFGIANNSVFPTAFYGLGGAPSSGPLSLEDFYGRSNITFTPDGGSVSDVAPFLAFVTLTCNVAATWTYSVTSGGVATSVSLASGASGTSIQFQQGVTGTAPNRIGHSTTWSVSGSSGGVTRNFTVTLTTDGD